MKKIVDLGWLGQPVLIVLMKTGVEFTNQTGGVMCNHPKAEGILIPLPTMEEPSIEKEYPTRKFIEEWIKKQDLPLKLRMDVVRKINKERMGHWKKYNKNFIEEAWIPVTITKIKKELREFNPLKDFEGYHAILTYDNSD